MGEAALIASNPLLWDGIVDETVDRMAIEYGVNDLPSGSSTMIANLTTIVDLARKRGVRSIYGRTVAPQVSYPNTEASRLVYNAFIVANSLNLNGYYDDLINVIRSFFEAAAQPVGLADAIDPTVLYAPYSGDGTHTSDAGQAAEQVGWLSILK